MNIFRHMLGCTHRWDSGLNKQTFDVLAVGNGCLDVILTGLDGSLENDDMVQGSASQVIPGGGYTTPIVMQRLGLAVTWAADFGNDALSDVIWQGAKSEGVDLQFSVQQNRSMHRISVSMSNESNRSFLSFEDKEPLLPAALQGLLFARAKVIYMSGTLINRLFAVGAFIAHKRKMKIIVDGNGSAAYSLSQKQVQKALRMMDIYLLNVDEALHLAETNNVEKALKILTTYCKLVVIKDGSRGALYLEDKNVVCVPAIPINAVDTTGAGDCFNAGFIAAWLEGHPIHTCVQWANITAGLSTTMPGGITRFVTREEVESKMSFYQSNKKMVDSYA